jgi:hypothetical protein
MSPSSEGDSVTQHLFLHVPKTAGSSIRTLISQNYRAANTIGFSGEPGPIEWYRNSPAAFRQQYALVHGHFPYGLHSGIDDFRYFTFLRNPVARHFSDFDFLKRYAPHPMHAEILEGRVTLQDWAMIFDRHPIYRNRITRFISGVGDAGAPDEAALISAQQHICNDFAFVGLTERFDESVLVLAKRLGWRSAFYLTKNVTEGRSQPTPAMQATAAKGLDLDIRLYAFAIERFAQLPELRSPAFSAALEEFRKIRAWLEAFINNNPHHLYIVGDRLPALSDLVAEHHSTPALDRYFDRPSHLAA